MNLRTLLPSNNSPSPFQAVGRIAAFLIAWGLNTAALAQQTPVPDSESPAQPLIPVRVETLVDGLDAGTGGLEVDREGNIYSSDFGSLLGPGGKGGHRVYRITPEGDVSLFASGFRGASGNCMDPQGLFYQSNIGGNFISRVNEGGKVEKFCEEGFINPVGIVSAPDGNLFVANCGDGSIQKVSPAGQSVTFVKSPLLKCPNGITLDHVGNFYVANFMNGDVIKISPEGEASELATLPGNNNGHLVYHRGFLYVIARSAHRIYRVSLEGDVELFAGSGERGQQDGVPLAASFSLPNDLAISPDEKWLYVNETGPTEGDPRILAPTRIRRIAIQR